jgi:hypothetical protein
MIKQGIKDKNALDILKNLLSGLEDPFNSPILDINKHFPKIPLKKYPSFTSGPFDTRNNQPVQPVTPSIDPNLLGTPVKNKLR